MIQGKKPLVPTIQVFDSPDESHTMINDLASKSVQTGEFVE